MAQTASHWSPRTVSMHVALAAVMCGSMVAWSGCTSLGLNLLHRKKPLLHADARHPVMDVICLWEAAEGQDLNGLPGRGFAGQVLFFAHGHSEPVLVDGTVTVFVFDDQGGLDEQSRPLHEFNFEGPAWNTYGRESSLGAAYQLFIPYTRPGTHHATCSIRVKYQPEGRDRPVFSKMATVVLPGEKSEGPHASVVRRKGPASEIHQAGYETAGEMEPVSGAVQASFESARPIAEEKSLETFSSALPTGAARPDTARLERLLRQAAQPVDASEHATIRNAPGDAEVQVEEEPDTAPRESRRYRL